MQIYDTFTNSALEGLTTLRNRESLQPDLGTILAAEIFYIAIIPFFVVEASFVMIATVFMWVGAACLCLALPLLNFNPLIEMADLTKSYIMTVCLSFFWATSSIAMNLLPGSPLKTREEAESFFCFR